MSSQPPSVQNGQSSQGAWATMVSYAASPIAASLAIVPVFYGFVVKSAQQNGCVFRKSHDPTKQEKLIPRMSVQEALKGGCKAAPTVGCLVGMQMGAQMALESVIRKLSNENTPSFSTVLFSSIAVGLLSAPPLAVFNGQTMGRSIKDSLKKLSAKQTGAIVAIESSFIFSLRISEPVSQAMKKVFGENKVTDYCSAFFTAAMGSLVGHPADTYLTLQQKGIPVKTVRQLMNGAPVKAISVGLFSLLYQEIQKAIQRLI